MSRIGRKPIPVPAGVKIQLSPAAVEVQGPKGKMSVPVPRGIRFEQKDGVLNALRDTEEHRALHGLARALVANAVRGVTEGFKKDLDIVGVGYRAELKARTSSLPWAIRTRLSFPFPRAFRSPSRSRRVCPSAARTAPRSGRSPRTSAGCARRIPTSKRASGCRASG